MNARKQFSLRMDRELYEKIVELSERERRSVSGQVEYMLETRLREMTDSADDANEKCE